MYSHPHAWAGWTEWPGCPRWRWIRHHPSCLSSRPAFGIFFTETVKSRIFRLVLGTYFFFIWNVVSNRLVALQMAELWVMTAKCYVGVAQVSPPYSMEQACDALYTAYTSQLSRFQNTVYLQIYWMSSAAHFFFLSLCTLLSFTQSRGKNLHIITIFD